MTKCGNCKGEIEWYAPDEKVNGKRLCRQCYLEANDNSPPLTEDNLKKINKYKEKPIDKLKNRYFRCGRCGRLIDLEVDICPYCNQNQTFAKFGKYVQFIATGIVIIILIIILFS